MGSSDEVAHVSQEMPFHLLQSQWLAKIAVTLSGEMESFERIHVKDGPIRRQKVGVITVTLT